MFTRDVRRRGIPQTVIRYDGKGREKRRPGMGAAPRRDGRGRLCFCPYRSSWSCVRFPWAVNIRCCHIAPAISAGSILMKRKKNVRTLFDFLRPLLDLQSCLRKTLRNEQGRSSLWGTSPNPRPELLVQTERVWAEVCAGAARWDIRCSPGRTRQQQKAAVLHHLLLLHTAAPMKKPSAIIP